MFLLWQNILIYFTLKFTYLNHIIFQSYKHKREEIWFISNHHLEWFYCLYGVNIIVFAPWKRYLCFPKNIFFHVLSLFVQDESTYLVSVSRTAEISAFAVKSILHLNHSLTPSKLQKGEKPNLNECISKTLNFKAPF